MTQPAPPGLLPPLHDYVRVEIEAALRRDIRVVPILVEGARMPSAKDLPESLGAFTRRNAFEVSHHGFGGDIQELAQRITRSLGIAPPEHKAVPAPDHQISWADTILSFQGRIARRTFWLWNLILLIICSAIQFTVLYVLQGAVFIVEPNDKTLSANILAQIGVLPFWWTSFALAAKRAKDFNAGRGLIIPAFVLVVVIIFVLFININPPLNADDPMEKGGRMAVQGLGIGLVVCLLVLWTVIGAIPGTPGPNRFGPDPRATSKAKK